MAVVWLIDLFGDYQSTNSKPLPPLSAQIVNPVFPQQPRRTFFFARFHDRPPRQLLPSQSAHRFRPIFHPAEYDFTS